MKKVSVIVLCYSTEKYIEQCIQSLLDQSYQNLELIAVLDDSSETIQYLEGLQDSRLKIVKNIKNNSVYQTRIIGSKEATGDYISFVDSSDYVDLDYYRLLLENAEQKNVDIVISNFVNQKKEKKFVNTLQFNMNNQSFEGKDFLDLYFKQTGRIARFHLLKTKLIKMKVWKEALSEYEKLTDDVGMTEDFAFSSIALYYAKKVSFCDEAIYYIRKENQDQDTKIIDKNIDDIKKIFRFVKAFLEEKDLYKKYENEIETWESFYISMHANIYRKIKKNNKRLKALRNDIENNQKLNAFYELRKKDKSWDNYFLYPTIYSEELSDIKRQIMDPNIEVISFDMFDTLVLRPFLVPSDMYVLLNKDFHQLFHTMKAVDFARIRIKSETELRNINYQKNISEVTIEEIYDYISNRYHLEKEKMNLLMKKELKLEEHFCYKRKTGYELYSLAKQINKRVILTSDIYIPKRTLKNILEKNGYSFDEYYISSELKKTKSNGDLYSYVIEQERTKQILHIGDNFHSDVEKPKEYGIESAYLPKTTDAMMGYSGKKVGNCGYLYRHFVCFNIDHIPYEENFGVRCSQSLVANYYFDNPFRPFNEATDFNADPYLIGYYALGMQTISMCKWLFEDMKKEHIDSIAFMARDGYVPYQAAKIYNDILKYIDNLQINYTYVSRKSLMPLLLRDKAGISMIDSYLNVDMLSPKDLMKQLDKVLDINSKTEETIQKEYKLDEKFKSKDEFNNCLSKIYDCSYKKGKYEEYLHMCQEYFNTQFSGKAATFDVGYSGKPEAIISTILEKPITTYFIHANNSDAYKNSKNAGFDLKTFYDYKPMLTGATRELFISYVGPSCIGYQYENNQVVPVFGSNKNYNFYNMDMIEKIQTSALDFVRDFCGMFKEYIDVMDLNKYYMSIPLEYYYNYAKIEDKIPTKDLLFDDNVNHSVELNEYVMDRYKKYAAEYSLGIIPKHLNEKIDYSLPKSRTRRIVHYAMKDQSTLRKKWREQKNKLNNPDTLPKSSIKRMLFYMIFDPKRIFRTIKNKVIKKDE